jgi:acetyl-CoA acetyltransferase
MIRAGSLDTVLVGGIDNSPSGFYYQGASSLDDDLAVSYPHEAVGITNPGYWAMWARRRAHEMGSSVEELKETMSIVKEVQSQSGTNNPRALYDQEFSREEVMESPPVCDPLHLYMISGVSTGGGAIIVTSEEKAEDITDDPVSITASEVGSPHYNEPTPRLIHFATAGGERADSAFVEWKKPITEAYKNAGISSEDIDIIECHDTSCFHTINWIDQIQDWERERTDELIRSEEFDRHGTLPVNLSGGTSAFGESVMSQGYMMIHELVQQLTGSANKRQATNDPQTGLCTAYGAYGSYGATILES